MNSVYTNYLRKSIHGEWVRLRTLIYLRWLAICGQLGAVVFCFFVFNLDLKLDIIICLILLSVTINLISQFKYPETKRLSEFETSAMLLYDLLQLTILLFLTGGLTNPFAVLIIAPVTISATVLTLRATLFLGVVASMLISALVFFHLPLKTFGGETLSLHDILLYGVWVALLITVSFLAAYARKVSMETFSMSQALLATQMALEREQKLTAISGVVAATAHELGTPLATIKLVSTELLSDLDSNSDFKSDVALIGSQVDRCRDILKNMGQKGKDDMLLKTLPILSLVQEATAPHINRGKKVFLRAQGRSGEMLEDLFVSSQPNVYRESEVIHGLRNLMQNAVDFAKSVVVVNVNWDDLWITVSILDDGNGFPNDMLGKIGDPFVKKGLVEKVLDTRYPEYEGMGLGLFIAKTLLEKTGAKLSFSNRSFPEEIDVSFEKIKLTGALVVVKWKKEEFAIDENEIRKPLKENPHN